MSKPEGTDDVPQLYHLSRRRVLGGIGAVGLASAGAGLGTSAFFSDTETWGNNVLQAGSLDLKIDWEEHYSDWSRDEAAAVSDIVMRPPNAMDNSWVPDDYVGLPDPDDPLIAIPEADVGSFMDATSIEAYPDENDDGVQDQNPNTGEPIFPGDVSICDVSDADLDAALTSDLRTAEYDGEPLVNLHDVKPGDFGELTLSFHLCDNPGYVWMQGANFLAEENGYTEPEASDPDESGPDQNGVDNDVELLDGLQAVLWYDQDGDNVLDSVEGSGDPVCVQLVLDSSGSMTSTDGDGITRQTEMKNGAKQLAAAVLGANANNRVGVVEFDSDANLLLSVGNAGSQDLTTVENAIDSVDAQGNTAINTGIDTADADLANCPPDDRALMIVVTDGSNNAGTGPVQTASDAAIASNTDEIFAVGTGGANNATLIAIANPDDDAHIELTSDLSNAIANLTAAVLGTEEVIFRGSFSDLFQALSNPNGGSPVPGLPLDGNRTTAYDEVNDPSNSPDRECFNASDTHHIGFAWYLPVDHANEIQTDSVSFDFGFYTEQCRHNDGTGQAPQTPQPAPAP